MRLSKRLVQFQGNREPSSRGALNRAASLRLTRGFSWIWKSRKAVSQRKCSPTDFQSGQTCVETSGDVIKGVFTGSARICRALSSTSYCRTMSYIGMYFCRLRIAVLWELKRDLHFVAVEIFEEQIRLAPTELTFVPRFRVYSYATLWRVAFPLAPFSAIASISSERNAVNKSSALTMNRFPSRCASTQKRNPCFG